MTHDCEKELGHGGLIDGQRRTCSCGKIYAWTKDTIGNYWSPVIKLPHDETKRKQQRARVVREAQSVWSEPRKR